MNTNILIFSHTQSSYVEEVFARLGKGKRHAALVYSEWFQKGSIALEHPRIEPHAKALVEDILRITDFSLPTLTNVRIEGMTSKFLLQFADGLESESVVIPMQAGETLCISSQIGCKMGCAFCETGRMGLLRHLSVGEIIAQVFSARFLLKKQVRNIVFMGMGEPFDNFETVMQAVRVLTEPTGLAFGPSRLTLSTSGHVEAIYRMIEEADPALNLAVSVNAPNDAVRNRIMPVNKKWNMAQLKEAMSAYCAHPRREIFVEYVLLKDINDSLESADQLAEYLKNLRVKVNLIPYNAQSRDRFSPPAEEQQTAFLERMRSHGYYTLLRLPKGKAIMAACGQLGNLQLRKNLIKDKTTSQIEPLSLI